LGDRDYREYKRELDSLVNEIRELYVSINIGVLKENLLRLEAETVKEDSWKDRDRLANVNQEISRLKRKVEPWERLLGEVSEARDLMEMALAESDAGVLEDLCSTIEGFRRRYDELETLVLLSGEDDGRNAFVTIHPGAGGTESQDWASMLFRMYLRWAESNGYSIDVIDYTPGEEAGIKGATALIEGEHVYGLLKSERGIHRLVRISPFDANKRRHTSFASVEIIPEVPEDIDIAINDSDLRIDTYRASGAGGISCVLATTAPPGLRKWRNRSASIFSKAMRRSAVPGSMSGE